MHRKTSTSHQLAQRVLDTEAELLASQQEILLLNFSVNAILLLSKEELLLLLRIVRADFQRGKYSPLVYKLFQAVIANRIQALRRMK